jgi:hypothetical protein
MSRDEAMLQDRSSRRLFGPKTGMHRQRQSYIADLDRIGRSVTQRNRPAQQFALRLQANGRGKHFTAIILHPVRARRALGRFGLSRVKSLPCTIGTPPRDLNMPELLPRRNVVCRKGIPSETEARQRGAIELERKRRGDIGRATPSKNSRRLAAMGHLP